MENYKIVFRKGDVSFELESSDLNWMNAKEKEYLDHIIHHKHKAPGSEPVKSSQSLSLGNSLTINEFYKKYVKDKKISSRADIAVFFVYYLEKIEKLDSISSGDVINCFSKIGYPNYNKLNMTDILNQAQRKALLNNVSKNWSVTITGEDFVLNVIGSEEK